MKETLLIVLALLLGLVGYHFGGRAQQPAIDQLKTDLAKSVQDFDQMDKNRPQLDEVQRLYCSISGFHDTLIGMQDLTILAGRVVDIDRELKLSFEEIADATIVSTRTVTLAGISVTDVPAARKLMEQMLLGYPDPRVLIVLADTIEDVPRAIVGSHSAFNNYAFTYVQGELLDARVAEVAGELNPKMRSALERIQQFGLKPMFDPTRNPRLATPRP